jgi:hypothetical protein
VNNGGNAWETPPVLAKIYLCQIYLDIPTASTARKIFIRRRPPRGFREARETFRPNPAKENQ